MYCMPNNSVYIIEISIVEPIYVQTRIYLPGLGDTPRPSTDGHGHNPL